MIHNIRHLGVFLVLKFHALMVFGIPINVLFLRLPVIVPVIYATILKGVQRVIRVKETLQLCTGNLELIVTKVLNLGHRGEPFIRSKLCICSIRVSTVFSTAYATIVPHVFCACKSGW